MENKIKSSLFIFLFILLLLPLLQQSVPFITSGPLMGIFPLAEDSSFSWEKWWNASYQYSKNRYLNDHFGFRPDMIRCTNQAYYSLLGNINHIRIVEGADHNLFLKNYIAEYYGKDFVGYTTVHEKVIKLKAIQDTLTKLGKSFVLVNAPGKSYVYPDYFPEDLKIKKTKINNLEAYKQALDSAGVNTIDFNAFFVSIKHKTKDRIWPRQSIHWSVYGSLLAGDSLVSYLEKLRHIQMPHPAWTKIERTEKSRYKENEILSIMNMIYPITTDTYSYPEVFYREDATAVKPKMIYIGDSFLIAWFLSGFMDHISAKWEVWYYFNSIINTNNKYDKDGFPIIADYDWINAINNTDCVIMMYTPDNLEELGNGFIEKAYAHYYPGK